MANDCEKYGIAITNYALDEKLNVPRQELFNHLLKCKKCREELSDWQNSLAVLRAEEYHNRPEVKKKTEELIADLNKEMIKSLPGIEPIPGKKILDYEVAVGSNAGTVWRHLAQNGWVKVDDLSRDLKRQVKLHPDDTKLAVGWLANQKKVYVAKDKQITYVYLTPLEREIHQSQTQAQAQV